MAVTQKNLSGSGVLFTDRRDFYISPQVVKELWTDVAPFTTVVANREQRTPTDPVFKMFEHRNPWQKQEFSAASNPAPLSAGNTAGAAITIDGISGLSSDVDNSWLGLVCQVWNEAKTTQRGLAIVSTIESTTSLKVKNLNHDTNALDIADNDVFVVVGNAHGEGTTAPEAWSDELGVVHNSTQIFKTSLQITGTLEAAALRGESSELARLRLLKSQEHKIQKERAFLFGGSRLGTGLNVAGGATGDIAFGDGNTTDTAGNTVRSTTGILEAIRRYGATSGDDQNNFTISEATYSYNNFVDDMEKVFQYVPESGSKIAFAGRGAMSYWSKIEGAKGLAGNSGWNIQMGPTERNSLGFNYRQLETPHGVLMLVPTPVLRGADNKTMLVVSEENLFHAVYRPPVYQTNIKTDDAFDGVKDQYMSDEGVGITLLESHKRFSITD
tara:strand:+ start:9006 stop:10328 length:1323 start_codon:yes stop_codon:yes gene_type:complete